jgi:hypothetical protein
MKSILQIFSAKTAQKFALVGLTSIVITACGGPETATPKLKDTLGPQITLNAAGDLAKVQATDGTTLYKPSSEVSKSDHVIAYKQSHDLGVSFFDPGAVARDLWEGYKTYQTEGNINTNAQGIQTITYIAHDSSGNTSTLIREVEVVDATSPVITLNGEPTELVTTNATFTDPSATAVDGVDGVITGQPTVLIEKKIKTRWFIQHGCGH